jgi:hypothetical protein
MSSKHELRINWDVLRGFWGLVAASIAGAAVSWLLDHWPPVRCPLTPYSTPLNCGLNNATVFLYDVGVICLGVWIGMIALSAMKAMVVKTIYMMKPNLTKSQVNIILIMLAVIVFLIISIRLDWP